MASSSSASSSFCLLMAASPSGGWLRCARPTRLPQDRNRTRRYAPWQAPAPPAPREQVDGAAVPRVDKCLSVFSLKMRQNLATILENAGYGYYSQIAVLAGQIV